jgi:hypothetical protein
LVLDPKLKRYPCLGRIFLVKNASVNNPVRHLSPSPPYHG